MRLTLLLFLALAGCASMNDFGRGFFGLMGALDRGLNEPASQTALAGLTAPQPYYNNQQTVVVEQPAPTAYPRSMVPSVYMPTYQAQPVHTFSH